MSRREAKALGLTLSPPHVEEETDQLQQVMSLLQDVDARGRKMESAIQALTAENARLSKTVALLRRTAESPEISRTPRRSHPDVSRDRRGVDELEDEVLPDLHPEGNHLLRVPIELKSALSQHRLTVVLDGKNFPDWDFELRGVLQKSGSLTFVTSVTNPAPASVPTTSVRNWAYSLMIASMDMERRRLVREVDIGDARAVYQHIRKQVLGSTAMSHNALATDVRKMNMSQAPWNSKGERFDDFAAEFTRRVDQLAQLKLTNPHGPVIEEGEQIQLLLGALPKSRAFEMFSTSLGILRTTSPSSYSVAQVRMIISETIKQNPEKYRGVSGGENDVAMAATQRDWNSGRSHRGGRPGQSQRGRGRGRGTSVATGGEPSPKSGDDIVCRRCQGRGHKASVCASPVTCYNCHQQGHKSNECKAKAAVAEEVDEECESVNRVFVAQNDREFLFTVGQNDGDAGKKRIRDARWAFDSAASSSMTWDTRDIPSVTPSAVKVEIANGEHMRASGAGDARISARTVDGPRALRLVNALLIPDLSMKLVSIPKLDDHGYEITFLRGKVSVRDPRSGEVVATGTRQGNLFYLDQETAARAVTVPRARPVF